MTLRFRYRHAQRHHRDGYVLLTTVLIIAMVSILTVGLVRQSMNMAMAARESQRNLQEKWGAASCHRFTLAKQNELLNLRVWNADLQAWTSEPISQSESSFVLGGMHFNVQMADESAKLNLNQIYRELGRQQTAQLARRFVGHGNLKVDLKPMDDRHRRGAAEDKFESWGQVFAVRDGQKSIVELKDATTKMTCWGNQLNYIVADESVITETCKPIIGAALTQKLVKALKSENTSDWESELLASGGKNEQIKSLKQVISTQSDTHSVWVHTESGKRSQTWLVVHEKLTQSVHRVHSFIW